MKSLGHDAEESSLSAKRKADVEKWVALLAAGVTQAQPSSISGPFVGSPPEAWRSDVEPLTPPSDGAKALDPGTRPQSAGEPIQSAFNSDTDQNRIQVRVSVGEFGELALVVERSAAGVSIQISAQDSSILEAMAAEREALTTALSGIGHSVTSLAFVAMDRVGINLARPRTNASHQTKTQRNDKHGNSDEPQSRRKSKRLNVIG